MITARGIMRELRPRAFCRYVSGQAGCSGGDVAVIKVGAEVLQIKAGIDIGEPSTQLMLTSLIGVGGITVKRGKRRQRQWRCSPSVVLGCCLVSACRSIKADVRMRTGGINGNGKTSRRQ